MATPETEAEPRASDVVDLGIREDLRRTFEASAYKDVTFGRTFTTIDAYHIQPRLTDVFGLCGIGWGWTCDRVEFLNRTVIRKDEPIPVETCLYAGTFWYVTSDGRRGEFPACGCADVLKGGAAEAVKKAETNLISKASSRLECGLSIYQGKGWDDPYIDRAHDQGKAESITEHHPVVDGTKRVSRADLGDITAAAEAVGVTIAEIKTLIQSEPFCVASGVELLAVHKGALLERIETLAAKKTKGDASHG